MSDSLDALEHRSVHILRETYASFKSLCMLWSIGKVVQTLSGEGPRYRLDHVTGRYEPSGDRQAWTGVIVGVRADEEGSRSHAGRARARLR